MTPRIEILIEKKLIGKLQKMSLANNKTSNLYRIFIPRLKDITNRLTNDLISMQVYGSTYFADFKPTKEFEKWATVEVTNFNHVPTDMETFTLTSGLYAVFAYKGLSTDTSIFQLIYGTWLPSSGYNLDDRPHLEVLGDKYKNDDPTSEEEIWIPIKLRQ